MSLIPFIPVDTRQLRMYICVVNNDISTQPNQKEYMKKSLLSLAVLAMCASASMAQAVTDNGSFDTQLNQAKAEIGRIADEGLYRSTSFDTQLNQAKAEIDRLANEGLYRSTSFDTQLTQAKAKIDELAKQGQLQR